MIKKLINHHAQGVLSILIVTILVGCGVLASLSIQSADHQATQIRKNETTELKNTILTYIRTTEQNVDSYVNKLANGEALSIDPKQAERFTAFSIQSPDGIVNNLMGADIAPVELNPALLQHLEGKHTAVLFNTQDGVTQIQLVKKIGAEPNYFVAQLNLLTINNTLNMNGLAIKAVANKVFFIQATTNLDEALERSVLASHMRVKQGVLDIKSSNTPKAAYQINTDMTALYASPNWTFVHVDVAESLSAKLINVSQKSWGLFIGLLFVLVCIYLKYVMYQRKHDYRMKGITTNLYKNVAAHLEAISNLNNAILSGVKFDEIKKHGVVAILEILPAKLSGIAMFESSKNDNSEIIVANHTQQLNVYKANIDKIFREELIKHPNGLELNKLSTHQFSVSGIDLNRDQVMVYPIHKEGSCKGFIFCALDAEYHPSKLQKKYFQNIAQHLGVALTTIQQGEKLFQREYFDPVTELYNQTACRERLSQEMSNARRRKEKLAVMHLRLIGFKSIFDTFGQNTANQLIKEAARLIKDNLRESDLLARVDNDEFVIVTSDIEKILNANRLADKLTRLFAEPIRIFDNSFNLATSIGISIYPDDGLIVDEMLNHASIALNRASKEGKNTFAFYEENLGTDEKWRVDLEKNLRDAINGNQLQMYYQLQFNPRSKKISGMEALMRWNHPERGMVRPDEFIKLAEETGLIVQIGQYARKAVFEQYMLWKQMGIAPPIISVNVSTYEIQRQEFIEDLTSIIQLTGIPISCVELEITETVMVDITGNVNQNLNKIHEMGIRIAIDDFGTGYSNLSYLGRLPFDVLKIDKSFMHGVGLQPNANQIVTMLIDMAHHLGKSVVAEGVETEVQYAFLDNAGCDNIQGYYISEPISAIDYRKLVMPEAREEIEKAMASV